MLSIGPQFAIASPILLHLAPRQVGATTEVPHTVHPSTAPCQHSPPQTPQQPTQQGQQTHQNTMKTKTNHFTILNTTMNNPLS